MKLLYILLGGTIVYFTILKYFEKPKLKLLKGAGDHVMTVVLFRHGEKPNLGLGNLNCRGFNRSKLLPAILKAKFHDKNPNYVFAPNPTGKIYEGGSSFNYIRPLLTMAPIAISSEISVNTEYNFDDIVGLNNKLKNPVYADSLIYIAWEHKKIEELAKLLMSTYNGDPSEIPPWMDNDYDTIFIFKITRAGQAGKIEFTIDHEGLNGMSDSC